MIISSDDVLHSFFIPEFRLKRDAVPGQYSFIQFTPTVAGDAHVFCAEYCGTSHSGMLATVKILPPKEYKEFEKTLGKCIGTPEAVQAREVGREALREERAARPATARAAPASSPAPSRPARSSRASSTRCSR